MLLKCSRCTKVALWGDDESVAQHLHNKTHRCMSLVVQMLCTKVLYKNLLFSYNREVSLTQHN
jgi:hypothetical protein